MHRAVICKASSADALITRPLGMRVAPKLEVIPINYHIRVTRRELETKRKKKNKSEEVISETH